jgi:hypothetical protein
MLVTGGGRYESPRDNNAIDHLPSRIFPTNKNGHIRQVPWWRSGSRYSSSKMKTDIYFPIPLPWVLPHHVQGIDILVENVVA